MAEELMEGTSGVANDTPPDVMKGDYSLVGYIDETGFMPGEEAEPMPGFEYQSEEGPTCRQCNMYWINERGEGVCTNVANMIPALGSCDIFLPGPNADASMDNPYKLPKHSVTYVVNGNNGFTCKRCTAFVTMDGKEAAPAPNEDTESRRVPGRCKVLKPDVHGDGCCIAWNNSDAVYYVDPESKQVQGQKIVKTAAYWNRIRAMRKQIIEKMIQQGRLRRRIVGQSVATVISAQKKKQSDIELDTGLFS